MTMKPPLPLVRAMAVDAGPGGSMPPLCFLQRRPTDRSQVWIFGPGEEATWAGGDASAVSALQALTSQQGGLTRVEHRSRWAQAQRRGEARMHR